MSRLLSSLRVHLRASLIAIFTVVLITSPRPLLAQQPIHGIPDRVAALEALAGGQSQQLGGLQQQLDALAGQLATLNQRVEMLRSLNLNVNCAAGETVTGALQQAGPRASKVTISIFGTCPESVNIVRSNTILRAGAPGAGLQSPASTAPVLSVSGAEVMIQGLTLAGGTGVGIAPGSRVTISQTTITGSTFHGMTIFGASVDLLNTIVEQNAIVGIQALSGSRLALSQTVIRNNGFALDIGLGSFGSLDGNSRVASNGGGVTVNFGSMLQVGNAVIEGNIGSGISAAGGSVVHFGLAGGVGFVRDNGGDGLRLSDTSTASAMFMGGHAEIVNNHGVGVFCSASPAVAQLFGSIGTVDGNWIDQVRCPTGY